MFLWIKLLIFSKICLQLNNIQLQLVFHLGGLFFHLSYRPILEFNVQWLILKSYTWYRLSYTYFTSLLSVSHRHSTPAPFFFENSILDFSLKKVLVISTIKLFVKISKNCWNSCGEVGNGSWKLKKCALF